MRIKPVLWILLLIFSAAFFPPVSAWAEEDAEIAVETDPEVEEFNEEEAQLLRELGLDEEMEDDTLADEEVETDEVSEGELAELPPAVPGKALS